METCILNFLKACFPFGHLANVIDYTIDINTSGRQLGFEKRYERWPSVSSSSIFKELLASIF